MTDLEHWVVPRRWTGETIFILGGGPSLSRGDVRRLEGERVIVINSSCYVAPWADLLYFVDKGWYDRHREAVDTFGGEIVTLCRDAKRYSPRVRLMRAGDLTGLSADPGTLCTGKNSGYQCINLAVLLGATRIILLGYDMRLVNGRSHWHGGHGYEPPNYAGTFVPNFRSLVRPLRDLGVEVVNATPGSALPYFTMKSLDDVLKEMRT